MSEIVKFVRHYAEHVTTHTLEKLLHKLPMLKAEFTQIKAPKYPHLVDQLEFLADVVEDFAEGADTHIPLTVAAEAAFALMYAHNTADLIPDFVGSVGHADDSSVVRSVLITHEKALSSYAERHGMKWDKITVKP